MTVPHLSCAALLALAMTLPTLSNCVRASEPSPPSAQARRVAALLREHPDDDAAIVRAASWALAHSQLEPLAAWFARTGDAAGGTAIDLYLAGRLWEEAGKPAHALDVYESCIARANSPIGARVHLVKLLVRAGWMEHAEKIWDKVPDSAIPDRERLEIDVRLAAVLHPETAADLLTVASRDLPPAERAGWAEEAGLTDAAVQLWDQAGKPGHAIAALIHAGRWREAIERWQRERCPLDDDVAYELARAAGSADVFTKATEGRNDERALRLRRELTLSLGEGSPRGGATPRATPHETQPPPTAPVHRRTTANERLAVARRILDGAPAAKGDRALLATPGAKPSLEVVLALLHTGDRESARKEWTRWQLEPDPEERDRLLPQLRRLEPSWVRDLPAADEFLAHLETLPDPPPGIPVPRGLSYLETLDRLLLSQEPGSTREAQLLYQRGRLLAEPRDMARAAAIAPDALVAVRRHGVRVVQPIRRAAERARRDSGASAQAIPIPNPPDRPLGTAGGHVVRLGQAPLPAGDAWHLESWADDPDARPAAPRGLAEWTDGGATSADGRRWSAGAIAPLDAAIEVPGRGWLFLGKGAALVDGESFHEVLRLEAETPWELGAIPNDVRTLFPAEVAEFIARLAPPHGLPPWAALARFLAGARVREHDPNLAITSLLPGPGGRVIARTGRGERAVFEPGVPPPSAAGERIPGYYRQGDVFLRDDLRAIDGTPLIPDCAASPTQVPSALERAWYRTTPLPNRSQPWIEPIGPGPPRDLRLPTGLIGEVILTRREGVAVTSGGHVLLQRGGDPRPAWVAHIAAPLPGPHGFPHVSEPPPASAARGPETAGPSADGRTPQVYLARQRFIVVTDRVYWFDQHGNQRVSPPLASALDGVGNEAKTGIEVRDAFLDEDGTAWVLLAPGDRVLALRPDGSSPRTWQLPKSGGFDLERAGKRLFVLGYAQRGFWLAGRDTDAQGETISYPLPHLEQERDRPAQRITSLGHWGDVLLLLHERLYAARFDEHDPGAPSVAAWHTLITWPDSDPWRLPFYQQAPPVCRDGVLAISRPWGMVEGWRVAPEAER